MELGKNSQGARNNLVRKWEIQVLPFLALTLDLTIDLTPVSEMKLDIK